MWGKCPGPSRWGSCFQSRLSVNSKSFAWLLLPAHSERSKSRLKEAFFYLMQLRIKILSPSRVQRMWAFTFVIARSQFLAHGANLQSWEPQRPSLNSDTSSTICWIYLFESIASLQNTPGLPTTSACASYHSKNPWFQRGHQNWCIRLTGTLMSSIEVQTERPWSVY